MAGAAAMAITPASRSTAGVLVKGGTAPLAKILPVQVFNKSGNSISVSAGDLLAALEWIAEEAGKRKKSGLDPIVAVNLSLEGGSYSGYCDSTFKDDLFDLFTNVFAKLRTQGVLPVVAAGNSGLRNSISFPGCIRNVVSVAATQLDGKTLASYSNSSNQVKIF
jgi:subtilisin family serine protease